MSYGVYTLATMNMSLIINATEESSLTVCVSDHGSRTHIILWDTIQVLFIIAIMLTGFVGNIVMCVTLLRNSHLRTVTNIFTATLGLTDLGIICLVLPMWIASILLDNQGDARAISYVTEVYAINTQGFKLSICQLTGFVTTLLMLVAIATVALISLDRYFCICHPLKYPRHVTFKKVSIIMLYIWLQSLILAATPLLGWGAYSFKPMQVSICLPDWSSNNIYAAVVLSIGLLLPFIFMLFSYVCIFQAAQRQALRIQEFTLQLVDPWSCNTNSDLDARSMSRSSTSASFNRSTHRIFPSILSKLRKHRPTVIEAGRVYTSVSKNTKTLKTVFIVVGVFVICLLPYLILTIYLINFPLTEKSPKATSSVAKALEFISILMLFSISSTNPSIFIFLTRDFRCAAISLISSCCASIHCKCSPASMACSGDARRNPSLSSSGKPLVEVIHLRNFSVDSGTCIG